MKIIQSLGFTTTGFLLLQATVEFKKFFPTTLGRSTPLMWTCGAVAAALLALGLFFSQRDLLGKTIRPWTAFFFVFYSLFVLTYLFGSLFGEYVVFTKTDHILQPSIQEIVPKLVEKARIADSQAKRTLMAQRAYQYCGVHVAYRRDDGTYAEYSPTADDIAFWNHFKADQDRNDRLKEQIIGGQLKQLPYVITLNAGSFLLTFLAAAGWFACKRSRSTTAFAAS